MTTLPRYRGLNEILLKLEIARSRKWAIGLCTGAVAFAALVLISLLVAAVAGGYWASQPPTWLRWTTLAMIALTWSGGLLWLIVRPLMWKQNYAQIARHVEEALPQLRNNFINSLLLAQDAQQVSSELVQQAIDEAARKSQNVDVRQSVSLDPLKKWGMVAGIAMAALLAFAILQKSAFSRGLLAVFTPAHYVPMVNDLKLLSLEPGDATRFAGEPLNIVARLANDEGRPLAGEILLAGIDAPRPMIATEGFSTFSCPLGGVEQTLRYAVRIGNSRWPEDREYYTITIVKRVMIEGLDLAYRYPDYTKLPPRDARNADGSIEAPIGTTVTLTLRLGDSVPAVMLAMKDGANVPLIAGANNTYAGSIFVEKDTGYRLVLRDSQGKTLQQIPDAGDQGVDTLTAAGMNGYYRIHAQPDAGPKIEFTLPNKDAVCNPGGKLATKLMAKDDYGLTSIAIFAGREGAEPKKIAEFDPKGKANCTQDYTFDLMGYSEGESLTYYATATDNRNLGQLGGPQTNSSRRFKIKIEDTARHAAEKAKLYEELRRRLMEMLRLEESQRVNTEICMKHHDTLPKVLATGKEIAAAQEKLRADMLDLVEKFPFDQDMVNVQQALAMMTNNEARLAIDQAKALATLTAFEQRQPMGQPLAHTQNSIINTLQTLLAIAAVPTKKEDPAKKTPTAEEMPQDAKEKLQDLKANLEKFIDDQKKALKATSDLMKKPVDNFNAEDEKMLKDLTALDDKWEKFLDDKFSDFSKMTQQDFANPVLLKELVSVKSDVAMAKDALSKKAAEIATALEDNGVENAKSLTANIEKWLPDKPDREQWKMEDMTGQTNTEAAELPKELEDLVGDLLEQEEDLFDQMEDATAKSATSGDKGIGWDAADGPISSMNAQGVTGNQLPNSNELSGRSGEGRSGKSSGEFVEDKAVGKGGRNTPTRLTPEPFQKGQVDDKSAEPPGGATGGGKVSGEGNEGLEGPVPPPLAKELHRLAGKQAALLSKAERAREQFKNNDYANFRLIQSITLMNRVRNDLENNRYQNALRAKDTLINSLNQTKMLLKGEVNVVTDSSSSMPKYIRDDIADAMKGKLPSEYREVLEQYYRRLSEENTAPKAPPAEKP